jgi:hypothetical protein
MPYIKEDNRLTLDECIENIIRCLESNASRESYSEENNRLSNEDFLKITGDINYTFSRILGKLMGNVSYSKIAMITGVLENIKQEFYRRVASSYEDKKIVENGDIKEYKNL